MSGPYEIRVYDNFHYMDRDESYLLGPFATAEEALKRAKEIVRDSLAEAAREHRTAEAVLAQYRGFGEDPVILGEPVVEFSAWEYAECLAPQYGVSTVATASPSEGVDAIPEVVIGVPLRRIARALAKAGHAVQAIARGLMFEDELGFRTNLTVESPRTQDGQDFNVDSVTRVITEAPQAVANLIRNSEGIAIANRLAALGSLTSAGGLSLESRLSVYNKEDNWDLHEPLLIQAALQGRATFAAIVNAAAGMAPGRSEPSRWSRHDLEQVRQQLPESVLTRLSDTCLTIQVPLECAPISAQIHLRFDAPHPTLGSGLLCLTELSLGGATEPHVACSKANAFEVRYEDEPPHFGAWCLGDNAIAYHQFLPDALYDVPGVAESAAVWAIARVRARASYFR